jgi:outer membrane lipoprotein-sorting protein
MFYKNIKTIIFCTLFSVGTQVSFATWNNKISQFVSDIVDVSPQESSVYVSEILDSSQNKIYLPFSNRIHEVLSSSLVKSGVSVTNKYFDANLVLVVSYTKSFEGLSLYGSVTNSEGKNISSGSMFLKSEALPSNWQNRSLRDISYEIAGKFDEQLAGQRVNAVISGLTGGKSNSDEFISDFTVAMNQYMVEDLNNLPSIVVKDKSDINQQVHRLKGKFRVGGNKVNLNYKLSRSDGTVIATASTEFTMSTSGSSESTIPQGMSMYPSNKNIVKDTFDNIDPNEGGISVAAWVNHESAVYRDGDRLEISIRPDVDAYIRVFYVTVDGTICQIKPISEKDSGFLSAGTIHVIGGKADNELEELIITNKTIGQETIKIFASLTPIEERFLPIKRVEGVDYACTDDDYKSLKIGMAKALQKRRNIHPVNEIKILVK